MTDPKLQANIIEALECIFELIEMYGAAELDQAKERFDTIGGVDQLDKLQGSPNFKIYQMASQFLAKHYSDDPNS